MKLQSFIVKSLVIFMTLLFFSPNLMAENQYLLFRHAEKQKDMGSDPKLTQAGVERAERIARLLENSKIDAIFSSDYHRTRMTVEPLAKLKGLQVTIYNPRKLKALAEKLKSLQGNFVIVGHSNTTPQLTQLLSGKEVESMDESQYSDIYLVSQGADSSNLIKLSSDSVTK